MMDYEKGRGPIMSERAGQRRAGWRKGHSPGQCTVWLWARCGGRGQVRGDYSLGLGPQGPR